MGRDKGYAPHSLTHGRVTSHVVQFSHSLAHGRVLGCVIQVSMYALFLYGLRHGRVWSRVRHMTCSQWRVTPI
ncbi:UDP-N-acetylmuramoyl-L-alanyl-D-glutamate--2,6-diaminopimelate ligase [Gossypium arboreum]|uniref:UDP-N-acetylmuramoyl-L-alanyl-D-glutamate--2, 6-diaminopimelate ligase n=1 Tax=Gossypium arboreum TaxID=29729 RepID=A0A0B0P4N2_GOSAR|nr:UDP-N-acetylmuramoyl-L-alanyl-D-glutamate--2,6-diaminopimelate ligase [Gossypium arboreum]